MAACKTGFSRAAQILSPLEIFITDNGKFTALMHAAKNK
jgi:hypothetical protein